VSLRLEAHGQAAASPEVVWSELIDWEGQSRWIPLTHVRAVSRARTGLGVRIEALSGFRLGRLKVGLLDRFVITGWTPPCPPPDPSAGELEILHLGPFFTGPGVFRLEESSAGGTDISCTEVFDLPGGRMTEGPARLALPIMRIAFRYSLRKLASLSEGRDHG
jgi:hypothetical protein